MIGTEKPFKGVAQLVLDQVTVLEPLVCSVES
jgi:hypothetical protein